MSISRLRQGLVLGIIILALMLWREAESMLVWIVAALLAVGMTVEVMYWWQNERE